MRILFSAFILTLLAHSPIFAVVGDDDWRASVRIDNQVQQQKRDAWDVENRLIEQQRTDQKIQERRLDDKRWEQKQYDSRRGR